MNSEFFGKRSRRTSASGCMLIDQSNGSVESLANDSLTLLVLLIDCGYVYPPVSYGLDVLGMYRKGSKRKVYTQRSRLSSETAKGLDF